MYTKLTLRIDEALIERAKAYSAATGKSVSQLVAAYLALLPERQLGAGVAGGAPAPRGDQHKAAHLAPLSRSLYGLLRGAKLDERDYRRYLEEKYL